MPSQEVLRSESWAAREVSAEATPERPLDPGEYIIVIFNSKRVADVPLVLLLQLDCGQGRSQINSNSGELTPCLRRAIAVTIASQSPDAQRNQLGPIETCGAFTPGGGYVLAAKNTKTESPLMVTFDFSKSEGFAMAEGADMKAVATLRPSLSEPELVAELRSTADSGSVAFGVQYRADRNDMR